MTVRSENVSWPSEVESRSVNVTQPAPEQRCTTKPFASTALSVQLRSTRVAETAAAARPLGAVGSNVPVEALLLLPDGPALFTARTR